MQVKNYLDNLGTDAKTDYKKGECHFAPNYLNDTCPGGGGGGLTLLQVLQNQKVQWPRGHQIGRQKENRIAKNLLAENLFFDLQVKQQF